MNTEEINPHLTAKIVVSYMRHHRLVPDQLADLITSDHWAIGQLGQPPEPDEVLTPAVSARRSVHRECDLSRLRLPGKDTSSTYSHATRLERG